MMAKKDNIEMVEVLEGTSTVENVERNEEDLSRYQTVDTAMLEASYKTSHKTWGVVFVLAIGWGTCTLANVGPSTTSSFVAKTLSGSESSSWIANAALFPLIGLQPLWVPPHQLNFIRLT